MQSIDRIEKQIKGEITEHHPPKKTRKGRTFELDDIEIKKRAEEAKEEMKKVKKGSSKIEFPFDAIPSNLLAVLKCFADCSGFCLEYYIGSMLAAASGLIGNRYTIEAKKGFKQAAPLYITLVGKSGIGKTPPMMTSFAPVFDFEKEYRAAHEVKMEEHHQELFEYKNQKNKDQPEPKAPRQREIIIGDATVEDLCNTVSANPIGVIVLRDELTGWLKSFNQYRQGGDQEFWLEVWNNPKMMKIGRVGKDRLYMYRPYITIIGGVQPEILNTLADGDKGVNGFLARFLFIIPTMNEIPEWTEAQPDQSVFEKYKKMMAFLHHLPHKIKQDLSGNTWNIESINLPLSDKAKAAYVDFYNRLINTMNNEDSDAKRSQMSKLRAYCLRFALILEFLELASKFDEYKNISIEDIEKMPIGEKAMKGAIKLTQYFQATSNNVLERLDSYLQTLPEKVKVWYSLLPKEEDFKTKFATEIAKSCEMPRSTMNRYLSDEKLFRDMGRGIWRRKILT